MKITQKLVVRVILPLALFFTVLAPVVPAFAVDPGTEISKGITAAGGSSKQQLEPNLKQIVNLLLFVIGAIAVIVIVVGGLRYVLSGGDSNQVSSAKNTILYAVVGLVVAMLAYGIVNFVIGQF